MAFEFTGGAYESVSLRANAQTCVNLYVEKDESGTGKSAAQLVGTPGHTLLATLPTAPFRGMFGGDGRVFAVSGTELYEVFADGTYNDRGSVENDGFPVTFAVNGNQLAVVSNGYIWVDSGSGPVRPTFPGSTSVASYVHYYAGLSATLVEWVSGDKFDATMNGQLVTIGGDTGYFTYKSETRGYVGIHLFPEDVVTITVPGHFIPASAVSWLDSFAVVSIPESSQINISAHPFDFSDWDPLDVAVKEGYPDHILRPFTDHQDLWLLGKQTSEVWRNNGNADFPFGRVDGMVMNWGLAAKDSVARLGPSGFAMLSGNTDNDPSAIYVQGYQPNRISTHAIEKIWAGYPTITDAVAYSYEENGHYFYVVSFPSGDATWAYDLTEKRWARRGYWDGSTLHRSRAAYHGYVWGKHLVGSWDTGEIWVASLDTNTDAGQPIYRERACPHISDDNKLTFYSRFTLDAETGQTDNPQFELSYSDDGGHTWSTPRAVSGGAAGAYATRLIWRRLGRSRDRVFRVTSTAAMRHVWINAFVDASPGGA